MFYIKQMDRHLVIENLYFIPLILSAIISLRAFKVGWSLGIRIIAVYLLVTATIELFAVSWLHFLHETSLWKFPPNNHWIYNLGLVIRYPLLFLYFGQYLPNERIGKTLTAISIIGMLVNYLFIEGIFLLNTYTILFSFSATMVLCLWFFRYIFLKKETVNLLVASEFWIAAGLFFYHAATLPLFFILNKLNVQNELLSNAFYWLNDPLNIIMYTFLTIAFLCKPKFLQ